jgi:hypothetical protein
VVVVAVAILQEEDMMIDNQEKDQEKDIIETEVQGVIEDIQDPHHQEIDIEMREEEVADMTIEDIVIMEVEEEKDLFLEIEKDMMNTDSEIDLEKEDNLIDI